MTEEEELACAKIMLYGHTPRKGNDNGLYYIVHHNHDPVGEAIERLHCGDHSTFGAVSLSILLKYVDKYYERQRVL